MRNSIHQSGLDYAALVTERKRKTVKERGRKGEQSARVCVHRICRCVYMRDGVFRGCRGGEGGPNRGREKLALEYLKARRGGGRGNEMGANAAEEQREARRKRKRKNENERERERRIVRETERRETLLGFRC